LNYGEVQNFRKIYTSFTFSKNSKITIIYKAFPKILLSRNGQELVIEMGNENYELIDKLESIAKSLQSLAESQKRIADTLEWMAKEKEIVT
jgi:hypothetical protein